MVLIYIFLISGEVDDSFYIILKGTAVMYRHLKEDSIYDSPDYNETEPINTKIGAHRKKKKMTEQNLTL